MNTDIFIFGYLFKDGTVVCPHCFDGQVLVRTDEVRILRAHDADNFKQGLRCHWCEDFIFFPSEDKDRLGVFRDFLETLEF